MNTNVKLTIALVLLLAGSLWAYADSVSRGDRFQRGQTFLPNLTPDEVSLIEITKGDETTTLERRDSDFTVAELNDYVAKNESVNRFLSDLLKIGLEKEIGRGESLEAELEIEPPGEETVEIALSNASDQEMVRIRLGKNFPEGRGRYLKRLDVDESAIYLSSEGVHLTTSADSFLQKEILDLSRSEVLRIEGGDFTISAEDLESPLRLSDIPASKKEKTAETNKITSILERLTFDKVYLADNSEIRGLLFDRRLVVRLKDGSSYTLVLAEDGERSFLRVRGSHEVSRVEIAADTPEEELREKADQLIRSEEIRTFNSFHDSWIYEVSSYTGDKLKLSKSDLIEDA